MISARQGVVILGAYIFLLFSHNRCFWKFWRKVTNNIFNRTHLNTIYFCDFAITHVCLGVKPEDLFNS